MISNQKLHEDIPALHMSLCRETYGGSLTDHEIVGSRKGDDSCMINAPRPTVKDVEKVRDYLKATALKNVALAKKGECQAQRIHTCAECASVVSQKLSAAITAKNRAALSEMGIEALFTDMTAELKMRNVLMLSMPSEEDIAAVVADAKERLLFDLRSRDTLSPVGKPNSIAPVEMGDKEFGRALSAFDAEIQKHAEIENAIAAQSNFKLVISQCAGLLYFNARTLVPVDCCGRLDDSQETKLLLKTFEIPQGVTELKLEWYRPTENIALKCSSIPGTEPFEQKYMS